MWKEHPFLDRCRSGASLELFLQKVPFPYTSMQDSRYFDLPALLPQSAYYDDIKQEACSDEAYAIVKEVVERFKLVAQEEYCDLYLYSDVLMQTDCMVGMRKSWREENDLDLFQSVTLPSAAFQAMWKQTGMVHPLITEENGGMTLMNELTEGMQGGVSVIFQPQATANNPMVLPPVCDLAECAAIHEHVRKFGKVPDGVDFSIWD